MHPRPPSVYITDQHWNFMARCWSMTFTDRPLATEALQFVGSALYKSTSSHIPTLSISIDKRHLGIARNDYPRGNADTRKTSLVEYLCLFSYVVIGLPVVQDIDSPLDARENYLGAMLPAFPSTTHAINLEPLSETLHRHHMYYSTQTIFSRAAINPASTSHQRFLSNVQCILPGRRR
jgi:hypothetical protein